MNRPNFADLPTVWLRTPRKDFSPADYASPVTRFYARPNAATRVLRCAGLVILAVTVLLLLAA